MTTAQALKQWHDANGAIYDAVKRCESQGNISELTELHQSCLAQLNASKAVVANIAATIDAMNERFYHGDGFVVYGARCS